jgi:hypothetical protein
MKEHWLFGDEIVIEGKKTNDVIHVIFCSSIFGVVWKFFIIARLLYAYDNLRLHYCNIGTAFY